MAPYFSDMRQRLVQAIASGKFTRASCLEDASEKLSQILEIDSLDLVEIDMELEARGIEPRTVGDLIEFFAGGGGDAEGSPQVRR
jgi:hypothetical protein